MNKEKKSYNGIIVYILITLFAVGIISGVILKGPKGMAENINSIDKGMVGIVLTVIFFVMTVGLTIASFAVYSSAKAKADKWDGENEEEIEHIENMLNIPMLFTNIMQTTCLGFSGCCLYCLTWYKIELMIIPSAILVLSNVFIMLINNKVIELEKKLNPEKKGSIIDSDFQKKWLDSCDEAEKLAVYKACYSAYISANRAFYIISFLLFPIQILLKTGLMPMISVTLLWSIMNISYFRAVSNDKN